MKVKEMILFGGLVLVPRADDGFEDAIIGDGM